MMASEIRFTGRDVSVEEAARIMGKDPQCVRQMVIGGVPLIGTDVEKEGRMHSVFYISQKLFNEGLSGNSFNPQDIV